MQTANYAVPKPVVNLSAVQVTSDIGHLSMDLLTHSLPPSLQLLLALFGQLVFLAVGALVIYQSFGSIAQFSHHSQIAGLTMNVLHLVIPVSFGLMLVLVLTRGVQMLRRASAGSTTPPPERRGNDLGFRRSADRAAAAWCRSSRCSWPRRRWR